MERALGAMSREMQSGQLMQQSLLFVTMPQSMRQSLHNINFRLNEDQLSMVRFADDQYQFLVREARSRRVEPNTQALLQISADRVRDASRRMCTLALERLTLSLHTLNEAFDWLTMEQHSAQVLIERLTGVQNRGEERGEEGLERSTQENSMQEMFNDLVRLTTRVYVLDIQAMLEHLVHLRAQVSERREEYSAWASHLNETHEAHGAPHPVRTPDLTLNSTVDCLQAVSIKQGHLDDETLCAICLDLFSLGESCKQLPCLHIYHQHCIRRWLNSKNSCPICRYELPIN